MTQPIITIIGGSGFLGRYVVREMARAGWRVRVVCRRPAQAAFLKTTGDLGQVQPVYGNLAKPETVMPHLTGADAVVNLVGIMHEKGSQKFSAIQTTGAEKIAQAARLAKIPVMVHVSALGVNKSTGSQYARTKLLGENGVRAAFTEASILRPSVIFGPEDDFYNRFARMSTFSPVLPAVGGGKTLFQPVWAADVARAVRVCVENPDARGKTYELGGPEVMSFKQVLQYVLKITERKRTIISLPFGLAGAMTALTRFLPAPFTLTADQVKLLKTDNVVEPSALTFKSLGIEPTPAELVVPDYLSLYRRGSDAVLPMPPVVTIVPGAIDDKKYA